MRKPCIHSLFPKILKANLKNIKDEFLIHLSYNLQEQTINSDYNLSPSVYVSHNGGEETLPIEEAIVLLKEAVRKIKAQGYFGENGIGIGGVSV